MNGTSFRNGGKASRICPCPGRHLQAVGVVALAVLLVVTGACGASRRSTGTYHDENMDFSLVQTVAVLPLANLTNNTTAGERVRDVFSTILQATGNVYVMPAGEVSRALARARVALPSQPTAEEAVALGKELKADVVITGTLREYGEVRSGNAMANTIALGLKMMETQTGKVVWSASSAKGGVTAGDRLFGGGGEPMNVVTEQAVRDLIDQLFE